MAYELPKLELRTSRYGDMRYFFPDGQQYDYDAWVPTLVDIHRARTIGEQRVALASGIVVVGAYAGLRPCADTRAVARYGNYRDLASKIKIVDGCATLTSIRCYDTLIGYQTPDERCPNPAFAVVDVKHDEYHKVFRTPDEALTETEMQLSEEVFRTIADRYDNFYPGFDLFLKLENAGVDLAFLRNE